MDTETYNIIIEECTAEDMHSLCRLCLLRDTEMEFLDAPLEEVYEDEVTTYFDIMQKLSPTKLMNDHKYPQYVCVNCITLLNIAYKVNRLMEISQSQLGIVFKEYSQIPKINQNIGSNVEIISDKGRYDLRDILIIEEDNKQKSTFEGFLNNLGSTISAYFVSKNSIIEKPKNDTHIVNLIPLRESQGCTEQDNNDEATHLENCEDQPETEPQQSDDRLPKTQLKCNKCNIGFSTKRYLQAHKEAAHGPRTCLCQICGHVANSRNSLSNHMLIKHDGKRFPCEVCGKKLLSKSHLRHHMVKHKNERNYLCTICGKNFNYASSLEYHMRIHTGEKKYKCSYCNRAFSMRCGLNRHLRTHTGTRPYKCRFCDKAFRSKGEVNCHETIHTGYRPYHCKLCGKGFTKTHNMKIHMLGHSGPVLCEFCQRGFTEVTYLTLHMKVAHGINAYNPDSSQILIVKEEEIVFNCI